MADEGYDVFLPNARGNFYSKNHIDLSPDDNRFWNFTWTDIGFFDYPAVYNYVIELTGNEKVYVVAHSQGTSAMMAVLSERPEVNDLVYAVSLLAPVGYLNNSGLAFQFAELFHLPLEVIINSRNIPFIFLLFFVFFVDIFRHYLETLNFFQEVLKMI